MLNAERRLEFIEIYFVFVNGCMYEKKLCGRGVQQKDILVLLMPTMTCVLTEYLMFRGYCKQVILNNQIGAHVRTTEGVRQGCPLSLVLFNIYFENIMFEALPDHHTSIP